ncbi:MAG: hypothetical protein LBC35_05135 [Coriobacteriales bacterium]|jgi:hypothetical protein|nr:hypothetical protein [Coriobacteriales bacterium]
MTRIPTHTIAVRTTVLAVSAPLIAPVAPASPVDSTTKVTKAASAFAGVFTIPLAILLVFGLLFIAGCVPQENPSSSSGSAGLSTSGLMNESDYRSDTDNSSHPDYSSNSSSADVRVQEAALDSGADKAGAADANPGGSDKTGPANAGAAKKNPVPVRVSVMINRVLVDDEICKITLRSKMADEYGDAGYLLIVENRRVPFLIDGTPNLIYLTPQIGTWSVAGRPLDPKAEGNIYPGKPGKSYIYFDELSSPYELVDATGKVDLFSIFDWWNPLRTYEFSL